MPKSLAGVLYCKMASGRYTFKNQNVYRPNIADGLTSTQTCLKIGAAAAIDPDSAVIVTPGITLLATRITELFEKTDASTRVSWAIMPIHVVRRTGNRLNSRTAVVVAISTIVSAISIISVSAPTPAAITVAIGYDFEIGAATMVDPYAMTITAPAVAFLATGIAALPDHVDIGMMCVYGTVVTMAIIRRAINDLLGGERGRPPEQECASSQKQLKN
jgi:hypothetical protein